jgi:hypothetical protein
LPVDEYIKDVVEHLKEFEAELAKRGTTFFAGKILRVGKIVGHFFL